MADTRDRIVVKPDLRELRDLLKALNAMDKESQLTLKNKVQDISAFAAKAIVQAGQAHSFMPRQAAIVVKTVKANRDRIPNVTIGGSRGRASGGANAGQLLFGNEFGGDRNTKGTATAFPNGGFKFPERSDREGRGNAGYYIFPTLKAIQPDIVTMWINAVDSVYKNWQKGAGGI